MCGSARCRILILQSGQFNVIPWGGGYSPIALHIYLNWTTKQWILSYRTALGSFQRFKAMGQSKGGQCIYICICISVLRQLVEQVWAVVDALAGGGALLGGPQPANALPLIDLSLPHYHLHHLSHSHQHTFQLIEEEWRTANIYLICPIQRHCLCTVREKSNQP